jgi:integrase
VDHRPVDESILTPSDIRVLLEHADARWRPLLYTAVFTGLRQGELLGLKWGDIDWQSRRIHVARQFSKGRFTDLKTKHSRRRVDMADELVWVLKAWKLACPKRSGDDTEMADGDLVFPHTDGTPLNHGLLLRNGFYPALRRAKLRRVRFHDLRHTFASLLIAANIHPKRIQALMGHSTIRVTMDVYGHLMDDADNEAANKITALVQSGNQMVTTTTVLRGDASQVSEKLEAGVGIEPAYTALQAAA